MKKPERFLIAAIFFFMLWLNNATALDHYQNHREMVQGLKALAAKYPGIMKLSSLGQSPGGLDIWLVTLEKNDADLKPAVMVLGGVEGTDLAGSESCLFLVDDILKKSNRVDSVGQLLSRTTLYILPRINPDAMESYFATPQYEKEINSRSMDLDNDGQKDEDGYEDMNGDGFITLMRVTDPEGDWRPDDDMPQLLRKVDRSKGEKGIFKVYREGFDNDRDGDWNEDEPGGVDLNRNFSFKYTFFEKGAGPYQMSEPESRAVADFCFTHPNIAAVFCFSSTDNLLHPWKAASTTGSSSSTRSRRPERSRQPITRVLQKDAPYFQQISKKFEEITGFKDSPKPADIHGNLCEWGYYHFGRWSFGVPAWWPPAVKEKPDSNAAPGKRQNNTKKTGDKKDPLEKEKRLWKWLEASGQEDFFIPWTEIQHPDFKGQKVEVGGLKPFVDKLPPLDSLKNRTDKLTRFIIYLGERVPSIAVADTRIEHLGDNVYRITAFIKNQGYLPTVSELGERLKWCRKIKVELTLDQSQKLASGKRINILGAIPGSDGSVELSWLVIGKKSSSLRITASSPMTGSAETSVTLK